MTDQTPSLATRALARLQKIAAGNGLDPAAIRVLEVQEQVFTLTGKMEVVPFSEPQPTSYPGGVRGKGAKIVSSFAALQEAVAKHKQEFSEKPDWVKSVWDEVKTHENQGWGLESAKVTLPQRSATYAATETCPSCAGRQMLTCTQCQGTGTVICNQCQGLGRERCYYCDGRGQDPQRPGQRCPTCEGTLYAPCRFCKTHRYLPCPTCHGRRGTPCTTCQATGKITQEVIVTSGAELFFQMKGEGLPSGMRRGLDRIGINNLGKGHADIKATQPDENELAAQPSGNRVLLLKYEASLPYAELRMDFGNKKAIISVVGKRCAISGVPYFLDEVLRPWREKLHLAALGKSGLGDIEGVRALREILALTVMGKAKIEEVRKLYPFGLSLDVIKSMLTDTRLALNKVTLRLRSFVGASCALASVVLFYVLFMVSPIAQILKLKGALIEFIIDFGVLGFAMGFSYAALNFSTRFMLQKRFPSLKLSLTQKIGKTGMTMLVVIASFFVLLLLISPLKPLWLSLLFASIPRTL